MAFIHTVKPLKHAVLMLRRNADARIAHNNFCHTIRRADFNVHRAVRAVIFDGIIAKVINHLGKQRRHAAHRYGGA